jgi:hypothetical protein
MKHIEDGECPHLRLPERGARDVEFDLIGRQSIMEMGRSSPGLSFSEYSSEDEDNGGGVLLDITTDDDLTPTAYPGAMISSHQWPELSSMGPTRSKSDTTSTESTGGVSLINGGSLLDQEIPISSPIRAFEPSTQQELFGTGLGYGQDLSFLTALASSRPNAHGDSALINPSDFWNEERHRYICNCNASFAHVSTFMYHVAEEDDSVLE